MSVRRPVLRYHGGKWKLAEWILSHMPAHRVYVEPFGGAGSVLLRKPRSYGEIYNDKWHEVVNVFRCLREPELAARLAKVLELTPYAHAEFDATYDAPSGDPVEDARRMIFRSFAGFGSAASSPAYQTGFRSNSNRSGTTPAMDWRNFPQHVADFTERLRGVTVENREAGEVMQQHDGLETLHYVDPPYPHGTRGIRRRNSAYVHELTDDDHRALAAVLRGLKGMVMLSSYPCPLYEELFAGWQRIERDTMADGARPRREVLWLNAAASLAQPQGNLIA